MAEWVVIRIPREDPLLMADYIVAYGKCSAVDKIRAPTMHRDVVFVCAFWAPTAIVVKCVRVATGGAP